jgi:hypothetical protein
MKACKMMVWLAVVLLVGGAVACGGGGKYAAAKSLMDKQINIMSNYADAMEKAGNAQEVAAALTAYANDSKDLIPEMKKLQEQFPDLKNQSEPPADLKPEMEKMKEVAGRIMSASMKAAQYMADPVVQEAQKKLAESMTSMK